MKTEVAIIDGAGANIASLTGALERLGATGILTSDAATIRNASHAILPGVGAAADAMQRLRRAGLDDVIPGLRQPVLGICLGMQLFAEHSQEDDADCLGIFPGTVERLHGTPETPVPNMGWCPIDNCRPHSLLANIPDGSYFYFVHSYALPVADYAIATATHARPLTAVAATGNFVAAQFHPERSSSAGARFLANFLAMQSCT